MIPIGYNHYPSGNGHAVLYKDGLSRPFHCLVYALMLCAFLLLGGCGNPSQPDASGSQAEASVAPEAGTGRALQKISIMLDWYPNAVHSFLYAAQAEGYFAEEGLDVDIQMPADTNDALKLVAAGKVDLALSYQPQVLLARDEQIPVQSIAALVRHPLNHLMVAEDSGITRPAELAGKQAGYSSVPLYEAMLNTMVKNDGGDPSTVKLADVGFDLIPALSTGRVDGIMGGFINHEQLILEKEGHPVRSFNPVDYGVPDYYELVLAASEQGLEKSRDGYSRFVKAISKGQQFVTANPDEALKLLFAHQEDTAPLDEAIEQRSLEILLPLMDAGSQPFGYQEKESWEKVGKWLKDSGLLAEDRGSKDAFVNLAE